MSLAPFYQETANEIKIFEAAFANRIPVMLKGPTGSGKTRFLEQISYTLDLPLITVSCHEDTSGADLLGRYLLRGNDTVWMDGPVTTAVRDGALLYLDEIVEAREDVMVLIHSLSDHRRELYLDRTRETVKAHPRFQLAVSYNPGYQVAIKEMKPSTRQRFLAIPFRYPDEDLETEIIVRESGVSYEIAAKLAKFGSQIRNFPDIPLRETVSTRLLIHTAKLAKSGLRLRDAASHGIVEILSDDEDVKQALYDFVALKL